MTREPDRFEAKAREVIAMWDAGASSLSDLITAALRQAADEALERAARDFDAEAERLERDARKLDADGQGAGAAAHFHYARVAEANAARLRDLKSPAAAPAAERRKARCQCVIGAVAASCVYATPDRPCECACHPPPSEPVAPAPSAAEKRIAELEAVLHECEDNIRRKGHTGEWAKDCKECALFLRISARTASPAAQGEETRGP